MITQLWCNITVMYYCFNINIAVIFPLLPRFQLLLTLPDYFRCTRCIITRLSTTPDVPTLDANITRCKRYHNSISFPRVLRHYIIFQFLNIPSWFSSSWAGNLVHGHVPTNVKVLEFPDEILLLDSDWMFEVVLWIGWLISTIITRTEWKYTCNWSA